MDLFLKFENFNLASKIKHNRNSNLERNTPLDLVAARINIVQASLCN
jgi:hypothetical protein